MLSLAICMTIPKELLMPRGFVANDDDIINYVELITADSVLVGANLCDWLENYNNFSNVRSALQKCKMITGYSCTDYSVVLNKNQISINLEKTTVKIKKFTKEEINQAIKEKEGRYFVLITNDIELPYTKEQAEEYVYKKYRYVTVDVELDIEYIGENVGSLALRKSVCEGQCNDLL